MFTIRLYNKYIVSLILLFSFSLYFAFAKTKTDYEFLAENGNLQEIKAAFKSNSQLNSATFGQLKENFLMLVLKNKRPSDIVEFVLQSDECDVTQKNKNKATSVMYAAQYAQDPAILDAVITCGTAFNIGTKSRVKAKDKDGKNSFDYALLNETDGIFEVLAKYAPDLAENYLKKADTKTDESENNQETEKESLVEGEYSQEDLPFVDLSYTNNVKDIAAAFSKNKDLATRRFGSNQETFLMLVLKANCNIDVIEKVISKGVDVNALAKDGRTALMYAAQYSSSVEVFDKIVKTKAFLSSTRKEKVLQKDFEGRSLYDYAKVNPSIEIPQRVLYYAAELASLPPVPLKGNEEKSEEAIAEEAESNKNTAEESEIPRVSADSQKSAEDAFVEIKKPAKEAASFVSTYLYDYALEDIVPNSEAESESSLRIADPNAADASGVTMLMKAAKAGNDWDVKLLLQNGADIQKRDKDGWTALMYAVRYQNNLELIKTLVDNGAYKRVRNNFNATPLLMAAEYSQNPDILDLFLKDRSITENEVFNAFVLSITSTAGSNHIKEAKIKLFTAMNIPVNRIWKGKTPLMYACQYASSSSVIQILLDSGARTDLRNPEGKTAFDYAKDNINLAHDDIYWSLNN